MAENDAELLLSSRSISHLGPLAQRLEQRTHNPLVVGSNPTGPTNPIKRCGLLDFGRLQAPWAQSSGVVRSRPERDAEAELAESA